MIKMWDKYVQPIHPVFIILILKLQKEEKKAP